MAHRKPACVMEFVALRLWFIFYCKFLSYLKDFPMDLALIRLRKLRGEEKGGEGREEEKRGI